MAYEIPLLRGSLVAGVDLSASQYHAVAISTTTGNLVLPVAGAAILGVLQNFPLVGQIGGIETKGWTKFILGATVTPGIQVEVDGTGRAIPRTTGVAVGYAIVGGAVTEVGVISLY